MGFRLEESYKLKEYYESDSTDIFDKIPFIIAKIETIALNEIEWKKQREISRIKDEEERIKREKKETQIRLEKERVIELINKSKRWQLAILINDYIDSDGIDHEYKKWALEKLNCINPNVDKTDAILGDFDSWNID